MENYLIYILIAYVIVSIIFHIIYLLDRQVKEEGLLFTQRPSKKSRFFSLVTGILLGGAFIGILAFGHGLSIEIALLPIASIALLAYSFGVDRPLAQIQVAYAQAFHTAGFVQRKKIIGIGQLTMREIDYKVKNGARFVLFDYCISPLVVTLDYNSNIFFIEPGEDGRRQGLPYILVTFFLGWFSILGPFKTIRCLISNLRGGNDVTLPIVNWLHWYDEQRQRAQVK